MSVEFELHEHQREIFAPTIFLLQELTGAIKGGLRLEEDGFSHRLYFWRQSNSYGLVYLRGKDSQGMAFRMYITERGVKEVGIFEGNSKKNLKRVSTIHLDHAVQNAGENEFIAEGSIKNHWDLAAAKLVDKFISSFLDGKAEIFAPETR